MTLEAQHFTRALILQRSSSSNSFQWSADQQLQSCRDRATRLGMKVGLYLDVAVGVHPTGSNAWKEQSAISGIFPSARRRMPSTPPARTGALAGFNAAGLEIQSFERIGRCCGLSMRYAGAIRLDHVLGLKTALSVPHGFAADNGVYVQMPFEALLAGDRAGKRGASMRGDRRGSRHRAGGLSRANGGVGASGRTKVMMFERDDHGSFRASTTMRPNASSPGTTRCPTPPFARESPPARCRDPRRSPRIDAPRFPARSPPAVPRTAFAHRRRCRRQSHAATR